MKLYRKLLLFLLAAAVVPLVAVGFVLLAGAERALSSRIADQQLATARDLGELVGADLEFVLESVGGPLRTWQLSTLSDDELSGVLKVLCRHSSSIHAAVLVDKQGKPIVAPVVGSELRPASGRSPAGLYDMKGFVSALPVSEAMLSPGAVMLSPLGSSIATGHSHLSMAVAVEGRGRAPWVLGVLVGMEGIQARVAAAARRGGMIAIVDSRGQLLASSFDVALGGADRQELVRLRSSGGGSGAYRVEGGERYLISWAPVPGDSGWGALVRLPEEEALEPVRRMRRGVLLGSMGSLLALLFFGWVFIRRVTRGLALIDDAARELGAGRLPAPLPEQGRDEVAEVSRTFNQVAAELSEARSRLERWNEELKAKVEERTVALQNAQAQLVEAQKLAAIGQLGAGVAHEINNPLTGILGQTQLLLEAKGEGDPDVAPLRRIEQMARRSREITQNLLRFSQQNTQLELQPLNLNRVVHETIALFGGQIREPGIALESSLDPRLPLVKGDAGPLQQVLLNLLTNARTACLGVEAAHICVQTRTAGEEVQLEVRDNGKGISAEIRPRIFEPFFTTKDVWSNVGLGLSLSYRIVTEHGGRILVESELGKGSTFTVTLPQVPAI